MIVILWVTLWEKGCKKTWTLKSGFLVTKMSVKLLQVLSPVNKPTKSVLLIEMEIVLKYNQPSVNCGY